MILKMSFEQIMERMLSRIPNSFDKREGSIIWDALAPAALELESVYFAFDGMLQETFAKTASREFLKLRALERGMKPNKATKSILKVRFNATVPNEISVPNETRFKINNIIFKVIEKIESNENEYKLECESEGVIGNIINGDLIQIDYVKNLDIKKSEILEILIHGKDEEDTESFRKRYLESFREQRFGGNIKDYTDKTLEIAGVGAVKVTPIWNGGGTVLLTILNSDYGKANDELIRKVQEIIDPTKEQKGVGLAPIGHQVTVKTAEVVDVEIKVNIVFTGKTNFEEKKLQIEDVINQYFRELKSNWQNEKIVIRASYLIYRLFSISNVEDVVEIKINDKDKLTLEEYQIPVLKEVIKIDN